MGTETEINPTRQPSQKPGIRFPLKGRKRPLCRACQTTVAHTLHMVTNTATYPPCTHVHVCIHTPPTQTPHTPHVPLQTLAYPTHSHTTCVHPVQIDHMHTGIPPMQTPFMRAHMHSHPHIHTRAHSSGSQTDPQGAGGRDECRLWTVGGRSRPRAAPEESGLMGMQVQGCQGF